MEMHKWSNKEIVKYLNSQNYCLFYEALSHTGLSYIISVQTGFIPFCKVRQFAAESLSSQCKNEGPLNLHLLIPVKTSECLKTKAVHVQRGPCHSGVTSRGEGGPALPQRWEQTAAWECEDRGTLTVSRA